MALAKPEAQRLARQCFSVDIDLPSEVMTLARLWGGMGHVFRVRWKKPDPASMIVKLVDIRQADPKDRGDRRKIDSYTVEANFYRYYSADLQKLHNVALPTFLYEEQEELRTVTLCLTELNPLRTSTNHRDVLDWLARFHAATWHLDATAGTTCPSVQPRGTYWHLDTRPDEWADMRQHGWVGRLRRAARPIDTFLHSETTTELRSWVHGDAKEANVLETPPPNEGSAPCIAMCDFQYVGPGCPLQDVCYFLCSSGVAENTALVDYYYGQLNNYHCSGKQSSEVIDRNEFDFVLEVCYCDYMRFMCGWGQWGSDISKRVVSWLDLVDGGQLLDSEAAYDEAIQVAFVRAKSGLLK